MAAHLPVREHIMSDNFQEKFPTIEHQVSYGIGRQMAEQLVSQPFPGMDMSSVLEGLTDVLNGQDSQVPMSALEDAFRQLSSQLEANQAAQSEELAAEGLAFLAQNAQREGVNVTDSGLQYEVLQDGLGPKPGATATVRTHYHGTLIDGTVFDSSYQRGEPAEFPVNGVIAGWTEALQMMNVGAKWRLYLPHELAYGERGAGGAIAPYSTLIFDVELMDIVS